MLREKFFFHSLLQDFLGILISIKRVVWVKCVGIFFCYFINEVNLIKFLEREIRCTWNSFYKFLLCWVWSFLGTVLRLIHIIASIWRHFSSRFEDVYRWSEICLVSWLFLLYRFWLYWDWLTREYGRIMDDLLLSEIGFGYKGLLKLCL